MLFASSMVEAKRATHDLFESAYAKGRRAREKEQAIKEVRVHGPNAHSLIGRGGGAAAAAAAAWLVGGCMEGAADC
jgi:hypothetical protein